IYVNLEQIHSLLFSVETKAELLLKSSFDSHLTNIFYCFKVKALVKYIDSFISTIPISIPFTSGAI
ncbi:hypothetical protein ACQP3D_27815, partial [Escherichia coli]